jgi:hypothetical protein
LNGGPCSAAATLQFQSDTRARTQKRVLSHIAADELNLTQAVVERKSTFPIRAKFILSSLDSPSLVI